MVVEPYEKGEMMYKKCGFTLIELAISIVIVGLLMGGIFRYLDIQQTKNELMLVTSVLITIQVFFPSSPPILMVQMREMLQTNAFLVPQIQTYILGKLALALSNARP